MTALVELERGYAFQTLADAARLEHDDVDEHDVEPGAAEPGGDPGPMPTPPTPPRRTTVVDSVRTDADCSCVCSHLFHAECDDVCTWHTLRLSFIETLGRWVADAVASEAVDEGLMPLVLTHPRAVEAGTEKPGGVIYDERARIATAIGNLPTTWPSGVKHSAAWMRLEAADVARNGASA